MSTINVRFLPQEIDACVPQDSTVLEAAQQAGIPLFHPCGGQGICGRCQVRIVGDGIPQTDQEEELFADFPDSEQWHLSCLTKLSSNCTIHVPPESTVSWCGDKRSFGQEVRFDDPIFSKQFSTVTPPGLDNGTIRSHAEAVAETFGAKAENVCYTAITDLPKLFPYYKSKWEVTALFEDDKIFCLESGDARGRFFGLAFDIGTTSLVVSLVDMAEGKMLGEMSASNPQAVWGADVIARLGHIQSDPQGLDQLRLAVIESLSGMIQSICGEFNVDPGEVCAATFVGNTIMEHTLLGISPEAIASLPFHPAFRHEWEGNAEDIGLPISPHARVYVSPVVSGYVGGDTLAVILATDLDKSDELILAVDLGTNGELVLGRKGEIYACAAAAGPAFEGGRIRYGMRAVDGAVSKVEFTDDVLCSVIGDGEPLGLCGSGLLDAIAELVRLGVIESTGAMLHPDGNENLPPGIASRIMADDNGHSEFRLTTDGQRPIKIVQRDVREFQLAKGAVRAGCEVMMEAMGCTSEDIDRVMISGAFGSHLRKESVKHVGLLPDFPLEKLTFIGNGAMQGSRSLLLSRSARSRAERLKDEIEYIELSASPDFQGRFADSLSF